MKFSVDTDEDRKQVLAVAADESASPMERLAALVALADHQITLAKFDAMTFKSPRTFLPERLPPIAELEDAQYGLGKLLSQIRLLLRAARADGDPPCWVYFAQQRSTEGNGPIKIGWSRDPKCRVGSLQTATPHRIDLLAIVAGHYWDERDFHDRFKHDRLKGEWFNPSRELLEYIASLKTEAA